MVKVKYIDFVCYGMYFLVNISLIFKFCYSIIDYNEISVFYFYCIFKEIMWYL